jgi:hypothetical protein
MPKATWVPIPVAWIPKQAIIRCAIKCYLFIKAPHPENRRLLKRWKEMDVKESGYVNYEKIVHLRIR